MAATKPREERSLFALRLIQAQEEEGVKTEELARDLGVSLRIIQKYRQGAVRPRPEILFALARRLNRRPEWFFGEDGDLPEAA